jgi:hypothetical protein
MSDSFRAWRRLPGRGVPRRWATTALAVGAASAPRAPAGAASAATVASPFSSASVPALAARPGHGATAPGDDGLAWIAGRGIDGHARLTEL